MGAGQRVHTYRTLVSHLNVRVWKDFSIKGIGYHSHLYTRLVAGQMTDEIEKWLQHEFETPAVEAAIQRVLSDDRLIPSDWETLARFVAAQQIRTPAWFLRQLPRWTAHMPNLLKDALEDVKTRATTQTASVSKERGPFPNSEYIPLRITQETDPGKKQVTLGIETVTGRGFWLFSMKHHLTNTLAILPQHRWTILKPPAGLTWFTSDDPVICMNAHSNGTFDFEGGWGNPGTEILLPLGPFHLLYTQVGEQHPPRRGTVMERPHAQATRRFLAQHAHRMIFASDPDEEVVTLRPRIVNRELYQTESESWERWHIQQVAAEQQLLGESQRPDAPS